jgi:hypothetical protein
MNFLQLNDTSSRHLLPDLYKLFETQYNCADVSEHNNPKKAISFRESNDIPTTSPSLSSHYWDHEDVAKWLRSISLEKYIEKFSYHDIDGPTLFELSRRDMKILEIEHEDQQTLKTHIKRLISTLRQHVRKWDLNQLSEWMEINGGESYVQLFRSQSLDGEEFVAMNEDYLKSLRIKAADQRKILFLRKMALGQSKRYLNKDYRDDVSEICRIKSADDIMYQNVELSKVNRLAPVTMALHLNYDDSKSTLSVRSEDLTREVESITSPQHVVRLKFGFQIAMIYVKLMTEDVFTLKALHEEDDFASFSAWMMKEYGPFHRAKCMVDGSAFSIEDDEDIRLLKMYAKKCLVKLFVHEAPNGGEVS